MRLKALNFGEKHLEKVITRQYNLTVNANSEIVLPSNSTNYLSKLINSIKARNDKK